MLKQEHKALLPYDLYKQIEEITNSFQQIQSEAAGILHNKADATAHLNDVLQSTENATMAILDAVGAIQGIVDSGEDAKTVSQKVGEQITRVYEASNFQDISGQQIKKVLVHLTALEAMLVRLAEMTKAYGVAPAPATVAKSGEPTMSGPQLSSEAPKQDEVDQLFKSTKA